MSKRRRVSNRSHHPCEVGQTWGGRAEEITRHAVTEARRLAKPWPTVPGKGPTSVQRPSARRPERVDEPVGGGLTGADLRPRDGEDVQPRPGGFLLHQVALRLGAAVVLDVDLLALVVPVGA